MTKTDNLGLCQWVLSDPISLLEMNQNFALLDKVFSHIAIDTYSGAGAYGSSAPNSLSFTFAPKLILIFGGSRQCILDPTAGEGLSVGSSPALLTVSTSNNGKAVSWFSTTADGQMNASSASYIYAAIG